MTGANKSLEVTLLAGARSGTSASTLGKIVAIKTNEEKALYILAYEFREEAVEENNRKIRKKIGARVFDKLPNSWLSDLRKLKNRLQNEISKMEQSKYHNGKSAKFAEMSQFEIEQMVSDYCAEFPIIDAEIIKIFIPYAVYLYYLR